MKRYFGIIAAGVIVLIVLFALSAAGTVTLDRPPEDEYMPNRSSYNTGATGTRAFYQLLEEFGFRVERWRENYKNLNLGGSKAKDAALIIVGPYKDYASKKERTELQRWVADGGQLLIVSRAPGSQFGNAVETVNRKASYEFKGNKPEDFIEPNSDILISQPTGLTKNLRGIAISKLAARLKFSRQEKFSKPNDEDIEVDSSDDEESEPPPVALPTPKATPKVALVAAPDSLPTPKPIPTPMPKSTPTPVPGAVAEGVPDGVKVITKELDLFSLSAPVVHLGDSEGAVLAECAYGKGRVIFLSDPFVVANNGIRQGSNVNLAVNLIEALGGQQRKIFFDEYHHGFQSQSNSMMTYFRGTAVPLIFAQLCLVALLLTFSYGKRFARPLPMPMPDRHSPLEFVGSMASLQKSANAHDLALENIYPRFKTRLCRKLGLPSSASTQAIVAGLKRRTPIKDSEVELMRMFNESEAVLKGEAINDQELISLVATMRKISAELK